MLHSHKQQKPPQLSQPLGATQSEFPNCHWAKCDSALHKEFHRQGKPPTVSCKVSAANCIPDAATYSCKLYPVSFPNKQPPKVVSCKVSPANCKHHVHTCTRRSQYFQCLFKKWYAAALEIAASANSKKCDRPKEGLPPSTSHQVTRRKKMDKEISITHGSTETTTSLWLTT